MPAGCQRRGLKPIPISLTALLKTHPGARGSGHGTPLIHRDPLAGNLLPYPDEPHNGRV
jgi:hypothetical protein